MPKQFRKIKECCIVKAISCGIKVTYNGNIRRTLYYLR